MDVWWSDVSAHSKPSALLHTEDYLLNKLQTNSISPSKMSTGVVETVRWSPFHSAGWAYLWDGSLCQDDPWYLYSSFCSLSLVKLWNFWLRNFCWLLLFPANMFSFQNMSFRRSMWDLLKKYRPGRASLCGNVISDSPPLTLSSPSVSS